MEKIVIHDVIVRCWNCNNIEEQKINIFENVRFIEQDFCNKCNNDVEKVPKQLLYDAEYNAL
jgi:formate dehydrogenase maturation protein FdhE